MKRTSTILVGFAFSLGACAALSGCYRNVEQAHPMGVPTVTVSHPLREQVTDFEDYTGQTAAVDSVQVRARVSGYLDKINFKEGAEVQQGDVLYEIDPRPYKAALAQAEAQLQLQQANLKYQESVYARNQRLYGNQSIAIEELQQSMAQRNTARANVAAAQAAVEQARLNLNWTKVRSPIAGLTGRTLLTRGNLVVADQTVLTTVVSQDPMYAYFEVDEPTVERIRELIRQGKVPSAREGARVPVFLGLAAEKGFPHKGYVDFINNQVNPATATLEVRAVFANPKPKTGPRVLAAGMFVRIRVMIGTPYSALLVLVDAVQTQLNRKFVYVLDEMNRVVTRDVELGTQHGSLVVIRTGLKDNDRVIVKGFQHVRPGMPVKPDLVPMPNPPGGAARTEPPAVMKNPAAGSPGRRTGTPHPAPSVRPNPAVGPARR